MALPGVKTVLKDRFYTLSRSDVPTGPRVVLIAARGTSGATRAAEVQDYDPYDARSELNVIEIFGSDSQCHRAYLECVAGGATRVTLVALPSNITDANLASTTNVSSLTNVLGGTHAPHIPFDVAFDAAETALPDIIVPWGRGGHPTDWEAPATPGNDLAVGFTADNSASQSVSFAARVSDRVKDITDRSKPCFAVLGIKPYIGNAATPSNVKESIPPSELTSHLALATLLDHDTNTSLNGQFMSVVASEIRPMSYGSLLGYSNGAAMYAGFLSSTVAWTAPTGKNIFNVEKMRYNPTRTQQDTLIGKGVVPVGLDFNRIPLWVDGITWGKSTSDYVRLSTMRIVFDTVQLVRQASQKFVGEAATLNNRNALDTAVGAGLRGMQQQGALLGADYIVTYEPRSNTARIDLILQPAFELRNIEISVSISL